jgi:hypothetical protein
MKTRFYFAWQTAWLLLAAVCVCRPVSAESMQQHDMYTQWVTITLDDAESAKRANVTIAPLFDDFNRAVSCRWDDNWTSDNETTRDVMEEYGIRGTWYLNDRGFSPDANAYGDYAPVAERLLRGGNSVGGHSLTHPYLTYFHNNRMFAEMSGVRIGWEATLDKPVVSYAYSFIDLRPEPEGREVMERSLDTLERAGFYHISEYIHFFEDIDLQHELSVIMPPENNTFEVFQTAVDWAYSDEKLTQNFPMITNSMHAWYGTPRLSYGYDELRRRLEVLSNLQDVWHCNQNQYAAYRRQFRHARLIDIQRVGTTVRVQLTRPTLVSLNDETPLTLSVSGIEPNSIQKIDCEEGSIFPSKRRFEDRSLFHLTHSPAQQLPRKIAHLSNRDNSPAWDRLPTDPEFPNIHGAIYVEDGQIQLGLRGDGDQKLEAVRVSWNVPIGWQIQSRIQRPDASDGDALLLAQPLIPDEDHVAVWGQAHFAAQVDFRYDGLPSRIHFTCQMAGETQNDSLPKDGFALLGPIPNDQWKLDEFVESVTQTKDGDGWSLADGSELRWRIHSQDGYVNQEWMNPEYVRTMGTWDVASPTYVLRSHVDVPRARRARILTSHAEQRTVLLNGELVDSDIVELQAGENRLVIVYPGSTLGVETQRLAACFVRFADPESGNRLRDIRYRAY